jgi:preprotein translocase subunit SecA
MIGSCLEGIGDVRGIELLQEVYAETGADYIGRSLETLCLIHNRDIPELPAIQLQRKENQERRRRRWQELNELAAKANKKGLLSASSGKAPVTVLPRSVKKIGRNQPCPCGSGKKYKKCCLLKQ